VSPPFHYVEKGDENDAAISCSVSATLFFCFVKQETKFHGKNFTKFCEILRNKILQKKHTNIAKYEMNCQISSTTVNKV
jgi:hypothetical protein